MRGLAARIAVIGTVALLVACSTARSGGGTAPVSIETEYVSTLGRGESLRLRLGEGEHYRMDVEGSSALVVLEPEDVRVTPPLINPFSSGASPSAVKVYDFRVRANGTYKLRLVDSGTAMQVQIRLERLPS